MISNPPLSALILITPGAEEFAQRSPHGAGTMDGVLIAALVLLCQICWAGALNAGVGRALSLLRLMAGQRLDACDPVGGGLGAFVTIYYNILSFNDKPIGLYRIMLFIFCRDGYGAIRTRPPPKKVKESRRMKQLGHARLPTPEESKKSIRDCKDLVGRRPIDCPEMLADATGSVQHIDATYTVGGVSM